MKYRYLEHTADAKFVAYGRSLEEAFINAGLAMFGILLNPIKVKPVISKSLSVTSGSYESLLYDYLEELLFLLDTESFLLNTIKDMTISHEKQGYSLMCDVLGDNSKAYNISGNIKSITYNDMRIRKERQGFSVTVVVDI